MSQNNSDTLGREVGKRLVRVAIAVVGLLLIRLVLVNMPMLKDAKPIVVGSGISQSQVGDLSQVWEQWARANPGSASDAQALRDQIAKAYSGIGLIFPISIATAIIDSLIFAVLIVSAAGFNGLIRGRSRRLPEGGFIIQLLIIVIVVALAYNSYMGVIPPLMGSQSNLYAWIFLVLGLLPLIGLIVVASRNLDAITEVVFSSTSRAVAPSSPTRGTASSTFTQDDIARLKKLKELMDQGVISKEDFEVQKNRILNPMAGTAVPEEPDELRQLKELRDGGALTEEEYQTQKRRILQTL
jgi:hypothetical protein